MEARWSQPGPNSGCRTLGECSTLVRRRLFKNMAGLMGGGFSPLTRRLMPVGYRRGVSRMPNEGHFPRREGICRVWLLVGLTGFAPAISCSQGTRVGCYATARKLCLCTRLPIEGARRIFTAVLRDFRAVPFRPCSIPTLPRYPCVSISGQGCPWIATARIPRPLGCCERYDSSPPLPTHPSGAALPPHPRADQRGSGGAR